MADRVKVLSVCSFDSFGGAGRAAYRIHQAVKPFGIDSQMFVKFKEREDNDIISLQDVVPKNLLYQLYDKVRNKVKNKLQHYIWGKYPSRESFYLSDLRSEDIHGALNNLNYDVLHLHWVNQRFLPLDQLPKNKPIIWTLHDSWPFCGICHLPLGCSAYQNECGACPSLSSEDRNDLSHRVWSKKKKIFEQLDIHVVAPSHWIAGCAGRSSLLGGFDVSVIPNCIDTDEFSPGSRVEAENRLHLDSKRTHILFGAINAFHDKNKGFHFLVDALKHITDRSNIDLIVFGAEEDAQTQDLPLPVANLGRVSDSSLIVAAFRAAAVTVVPSLSENLSNTIMESLACGAPVVAFDTGGNKDLIDHKENGYLARMKDVEDLANGILWCLDNNCRGELSSIARGKIIHNFTPRAVGQRYADLYKMLAQ